MVISERSSLPLPAHAPRCPRWPPAPLNCSLTSIFLQPNHLSQTWLRLAKELKIIIEREERYLASQILLLGFFVFVFFMKSGWSPLALPSAVFAQENKVWHGSSFALLVHGGGRGVEGRTAADAADPHQEVQRNLLRTCPHRHWIFLSHLSRQKICVNIFASTVSPYQVTPKRQTGVLTTEEAAYANRLEFIIIVIFYKGEANPRDFSVFSAPCLMLLSDRRLQIANANLCLKPALN